MKQRQAPCITVLLVLQLVKTNTILWEQSLWSFTNQEPKSPRGNVGSYLQYHCQGGKRGGTRASINVLKLSYYFKLAFFSWFSIYSIPVNLYCSEFWQNWFWHFLHFFWVFLWRDGPLELLNPPFLLISSLQIFFLNFRMVKKSKE